MLNPPRSLTCLCFLIALGAETVFQMGCSRPAKAPDTPVPKVEGERITFSPKAPQLAALLVGPVENAETLKRRFTGRLTWNDDATVRIYTPVAGRVKKIDVKLGDRLPEGGALAEIESPDFGQAQADLRKANADAHLAEQTLTRERDLFEHGAIPRKDLETAENAYESARSESQRAAAKLSLYGANATDVVDQLYILKTPMAGIVVERNANPGQELRSDMMLANDPHLLLPQFVVSDPTQLFLWLDINEMDAGALQAGMPLRVMSRAFPDKVFWANSTCSAAVSTRPLAPLKPEAPWKIQICCYERKCT